MLSEIFINLRSNHIILDDPLLKFVLQKKSQNLPNFLKKKIVPLFGESS